MSTNDENGGGDKPAPPSSSLDPSQSPAPSAAPSAPPSASEPMTEAAPAPAFAPATFEAAPEPPPVVLEAPPATPDSILPFGVTDPNAALHEAIGARPPRPTRSKRADEPTDSDGLPDEARRRRRMMMAAAAAIVAGAGITALVLVGRVNSERYFMTCTTTEAIAEQGRSFPPWGSTRLGGAEWRPVPLPANATCKSQELGSRGQLEAVFLDVLLERTSAMLSTRNFLEASPQPAGSASKAAPPSPPPLEAINMQLEQAMLLSRPPERAEKRKLVERMQGDVQYWRASLQLRTAVVALGEAARQYEQAALARPLHVTDASDWATFLRRLDEELRAGPAGATAASAPTAATATTSSPATDRPTAPAGTALPVEPPAAGSAAPADSAPAVLPDAGVPTGGVLL